MPQCKSCGEEAEELVQVEIDGRKKRVCESCAEQVEERQSILKDSEAAVQNMMGFRGRR